MQLTRLIYCSKLCPLSTGSIEKILESSRRYNTSNAITGILLFNGTFFLQCLEGGRIAVNETYCRILHDDRHIESVLLSYETIDRREFGDWAMGYVAWTKDLRPIIRAYSITDEFSPYQLSGSSALGLLRELSTKVASC
ncbi:BLUF domain-containing protein [Thiospirillum jenense]|uniref:BLUF domain-containing protein n=1 Tax=Thiospirillum jenense TaxID=1653858 RepID=A0A839HPX9_9GAMM|nr:BLUF domain-containing protein [Thiospirillum jenense]MBB1127212.1 BLUF domain-containing protein [Thiospirillum jenense]